MQAFQEWKYLENEFTARNWLYYTILVSDKIKTKTQIMCTFVTWKG
jgi:hypothetical protein